MERWRTASLGRLDRALTRRANGAARADPSTQGLIALLAERLAVVEVGLMIVVLIGGRAASVTRMLLGVASVYGVSEALGRAWRRRRPFVELDGVVALVDHAAERSFPSRHTAAAVAMATIGYRAHPRLGVWMLLIGTALGLSRVCAGVHYPSDVLAGAVLGGVVGAVLRERSGDS